MLVEAVLKGPMRSRHMPGSSSIDALYIPLPVAPRALYLDSDGCVLDAENPTTSI